jgi:sugar lactone lactonase YvrE
MWGTRTTFILALATATLAGGVAAAASGSGPRSYTIWRLGGSGHQCLTPPACAGSGSGTGALLSFPEAAAVGRDGTVYIADYGNDEVRKITPDGKISLVAGTGAPCDTHPRCGDGQSALRAPLTSPAGVAVDSKGVYIADTGDNEIRLVTPKGVIIRIAGTGSRCGKPSACGDGGEALKARLSAPSGLALDRHGNLYIADTGDHEIRRVSVAGMIGHVAGSGADCLTPGSCGDGGAATSAKLSFPEGVAVSRSGLYIADSGDQQIRKVSGGKITLVAGTGALCADPAKCGDGGPATKATLSFPDGVAVGASGNVIIADAGDNAVRLVSGNGTISRVAGNGNQCGAPPACGDNQSGSSAQLDYPDGVAVDGRGNIYVADTGDHEVRFLSRARVAHITAHRGSISLAAFATAVRHSAVIVRYITGAAGSVALSVTRSGHSAVVARGHPVAGLGRIVWDRRLKGHRAPSGRYKLTLKETVGGHSGSVVLHVHL